jgi:asparagine synthase (glutamine-hydrolysing)
MCGIAALLSPDKAWREASMRRMLTALRHRGPDGEGAYHDDNASLGHRRLAIIDLANGAQPLQNADGTLQLVANGEIYNYRELRQTLERDGYAFRTHSDCEVIIALYERYGTRLVEHLRGMFAFVLWDARERRLIAARDHLGQKPLYYRFDERGFACASEIKAVIAADDIKRPSLNLQALDQYLALRVIDAPLSMFEGIEKLPPAHLLTLEPGGTPEIRRYWKLSYAEKHTAQEETLIDELEARIEEALRLHMVSDVPVGAFLSGGMDSSLLVAMIAKRLQVERLPTFTMGIDYARFDEAPAARRVAQTYGTEHHEGRIEPDLVSHLPDLIWALDEPSDPLSLCTWLLAEFTRQHVKVVIGGDGGDELFGGYDRYYGNIYAGRYGKVPEPLRRRVLQPAFSLLPASGWYKSAGHKLRWLHHLSFYEGGARYAASLSYFYFDRARRERLYTPAARERLAAFDAEAAIRVPYEQSDGDPLDRMLYADSMVRLPNHPVMITDRMCMAHGLEARSPFMDHKLAEFAAGIPSQLKIRGGSLRYIQRKLAERYLPADVLNRPKQGFASALPYLLKEQYARLCDICLRDSHLAAADIVDRAQIKRLIDEHARRRDDHGNRLWLLINAELWYRMMIEGESREAVRRLLTASPDRASLVASRA